MLHLFVTFCATRIALGHLSTLVGNSASPWSLTMCLGNGARCFLKTVLKYIFSFVYIEPVGRELVSHVEISQWLLIRQISTSACYTKAY